MANQNNNRNNDDDSLRDWWYYENFWKPWAKHGCLETFLLIIGIPVAVVIGIVRIILFL